MVHSLDGSLIDAIGVIVPIAIAALWAFTPASDLTFAAAGTCQIGFRAVLRMQVSDGAVLGGEGRISAYLFLIGRHPKETRLERSRQAGT